MSEITLSVCADSTDTQAVLATLRDRIGPQKFNAWFGHGTKVSIEDDHVQVFVPNPFVAGWIENHYRADVSAAVESHTGSLCPVVVTIDPNLSRELHKKQFDRQAKIVSKATHGQAQRNRKPAKLLRHRLKDFIVGQSNRLAYSAAQAVIADRRAPFRPLFIHGSCGVGKTHLLQGICNSMSGMVRNGRPLNWRYITGEQFTNEFVHAIRNKKFSEFRAKFRKLDLLAIDDVHFLAAKKAIQEEFLHTFNAIESSGSQIVLASDAHPRMVGKLSAQLTSRFVAGMVVKIDAPDKATRMEILRCKAKDMKLTVDEDVMEYVARHIRASVRELEGILFKLAALSSLDTSPVTIQIARDALGDHLARTDSVMTLGDIEAVVATFFGITPADIHSSRRTMTVSVARMLAIFLARRNTQMSYPEIGRFMGKNHSSAVLAVKRMEKNLADDKQLSWICPMGKKSMPAKEVLKLLTDQLS